MIQKLKKLFSALLGFSVVLLAVQTFYPDEFDFITDYWDGNYTEESQFKVSGALRCDGNWVHTYKQLHEQTLKSSKRERKYLVYYCKGHSAGCGGYGNRMMGIISTFYLAVLTNRTFLIHWGGPEKFDQYFKPNMIDWTFDERRYKGLRSRDNRWGLENHPGYERQVILRQKNFLKWAENTNIEGYLNEPVERISTIWYFAPQIWNNPFLKKRAKEVGLPLPRKDYPYGMIGCAMKFLFKKSRYLVKAFRKAKQALDSRERPFIGIHIRTSDHHFGINNKDSFRTREPRAVFACAQRIENALKRKNHLLKGKTFTWFLAADDKNVKLEALRRYPSNVVTLDINPNHMEYTSRYKDVFRDLLLDQLLLLECDFFVPTRDSTFSYMVIGTRHFPHTSLVFGEKCNLNEREVSLSAPLYSHITN
ncbi:predicted protein [Nematostella vectensis]|uniref:Uncharacterized protein n=1 Tax=Nematostella vectensis TaxID=45351 RepID=A7RXD5_NEMVE|nr:uncharacterized protein LOC5515700 [Nematostella vectensis]EDO43826.1 predicted protein [Nematostella vectensis]|eukprot:XP_001635889.1 predicted protein [Nematostella vectensis]